MTRFGQLVCSSSSTLLFATFQLVALIFIGSTYCLAQSTDEQPKAFAGLKYRCIGPFRGGRVTAVAGVANQTSVYYFGSAGGGIWKTENAGTTWTNISDGQFETGSVGSIAVAPSDPNVIYVGMGEGPIRGVTTSHGDGLYRSTDRGKTWERMGLEHARQIPAIRVHPQNPDVLYVAVQGSPWGPSDGRGVYRSVDGGNSWEQVLEGNPTTGACDLTMDVTNPRILYAAMWDHQRVPWQIRSGGDGNGIYKTTDGGDSWKKLDKGLPKTSGKTGIAVSPANPERVWAIIESDKGGLYRSDDAGKSWKLINDRRVLRARAWYYMHIFADPIDSETVYVLNSPMMKSTDGGKTFSQVKTPHVDNHALWINPNDHRTMINGNDGGANVSVDGGKTWSTQMNQPTAQFYRAITDEQYPYNIYGGQQDNSTVRIASETFENGIGRGDWESVGGGESAHVAFDPTDPSLIYATSIVGWITEYDARTRSVRQIQSYPQVGLGTDPQGYKYRFNWNAPVVVSAHDPQVIYHAANVLLKSNDRGNNWTVISPDLTRNDPSQQARGGVPFTNEAAGGEIYNTIFFVAESPHSDGTLWVGSDDGLVHVTRDGGTNWNNVTPPTLGEAQINSIEISPHDENTVYVAATKFKLNDFTPLIYRTKDAGTTWELFVDGLPPDSFSRVVREDPVRRSLLFAGTETGVHFSLDDGPWQKLQLNLPVVPVTDLRIASGDLVVATQGRAFWILDDISPIRQWNEQIAEAEFYMYQPSPAIRVLSADGFAKKPGKNPPRGAIIDVEFREAPDPETLDVSLAFIDEADRVIRTLSNQSRPESDCYASTKEPHADKGEPYGKLKLKQGTNRIVWDLRYENIPCVEGHLIPMGWSGPRVTPGHYRVRLTVNGQTIEHPLSIQPDPRSSKELDYLENSEWITSIYKLLGDVHDSVNATRSIRDQIKNRIELAKNLETSSSIEQLSSELLDAIQQWEQTVIQSKRETQQDLVNYPPGISLELVYLMSQADAAGPPTTSGTKQRLADLKQRWLGAKSQMAEIIGTGVEALNQELSKNGIPSVMVSRSDKPK